MDGTIAPGRKERKELLAMYRRHPDPAVRLRVQIILLRADGHSWSVIVSVLYCSPRTIARWRKRYLEGGLDALTEERRGRRSVVSAWLGETMAGWVTRKSPRDFGFLRSRWCCGLIVMLLAELFGVRVSTETVRRHLRREQRVYRRPRPVLKPKDPQRSEKLRKLRSLLANLPSDEIAVFEDEVDINLNPKIGAMWMPLGRQATVPTPGNNEKRYLAGSLNGRTGDVILTEGLPGEGRSSRLFVRHLEDLRGRLRRYRVIHVICDNARFHTGRPVREYLAAHAGRIVLHFLPKYAPETNPIERIWWHLHEEITRNHRCGSMDELLDLVFDWLEGRKPFPVEDHAYQRHAA